MLIVFIIFAALLTGLVCYAASKPDIFRVERSLTIAASPEKIFPYLNETRKADAWSPWNRMDPAMKKSFSGPESGVGAITSWDGNAKVGAGRSEIISSVPNSRVELQLDFARPMKNRSLADYTLISQGAGSQVTWTMTGPQSLIAKIMGVVLNCDKMVGSKFEEGLQNLKKAVEA